MKTIIKNLFLLPALVAAPGLILAGRVTAQTFTTLHSFAATNVVPFTTFTNSEGAYPRAGVILSGNILYATAVFGGSSGGGAVFKVHTDGTGFTVLHHFTGGIDGIGPRSMLLLAGDTLYGTAKNGGSSGNGTVFKVKIDGTAFTTLHHFTAVNPDTGANSDAAQPYGELILSGNTLYGTAFSGGSTGNGAVFKVNSDGTGFSNLHSFTYTDGSQPYAGLVLAGSTLYGTSSAGGGSGNGTVFAINTNGSGFATLYNFSATAGPFRPNSDGAVPITGLVLSGNTLYGTAAQGGSTGNGTVFSIKTDGTGFAVLHSFSAVPDPDNPPYINDDGATPTGALILLGNRLYGTTQVGGSVGAGAVFALNTDGTGFTNLHTFTGSDGANPFGTLISSGTTLYGTASSIYASSISITNFGTVFSLSFPAPQLTINSSGTNIVVTWPASYAGFDYSGFRLQSAPATTGTFTNLPAATSSYTNLVAGSQQYFRLISN